MRICENYNVSKLLYEMYHHFSMGAINKLTNEYEYPRIDEKGKKYMCPECKKDVNFCKGKIKQPYFAHKRTESPCYYIYPSGKCIKIQGYEHYVLNELLKTIEETKIITGAKNVPTIWYMGIDGKKHRHYVDIFIPT
jgi:hypothetical protein